MEHFEGNANTNTISSALDNGGGLVPLTTSTELNLMPNESTTRVNTNTDDIDENVGGDDVSEGQLSPNTLFTRRFLRASAVLILSEDEKKIARSVPKRYEHLWSSESNQLRRDVSES